MNKPRVAPTLFGWKPFLLVLLTAALALAVIASVEWSFQSAQKSLAAMDKRDKERMAAETLLRQLIDAEAAQRRYLLTGMAGLLRPFNDADRNATTALQQLNAFYEHEPEMSAVLQAVNSATKAELAELRLTLKWYGEGQESAWREMLVSEGSQARMTAVRQSVSRLINEATAMADQEQASVLNTLNLGRQAVHLTTLIAVIGMVFFLRNNAALHRAQHDHAQMIAGERDRLETQVKQRTQELAQLNLHLQTLREGERGMLARSLHDELGAVLTAAKLDATRLRRSAESLPPALQERLRHLSEAVDAGIVIKRRIIEDLMPSALHNLGLRPALEILANQFRRDNEIEIHLSVADFAAGEACRNAVFQVVQESLRNIGQHAHASNVQVIVDASDDMADVRVRDDGAGFDLRSLESAVESQRQGLSRLRYRIEVAGGRFAVFAAPGQGTEVRARVPLA